MDKLNIPRTFDHALLACIDNAIGELCRDGQTIFYAFDHTGAYLEHVSRDALFTELTQRVTGSRWADAAPWTIRLT